MIYSQLSFYPLHPVIPVNSAFFVQLRKSYSLQACLIRYAISLKKRVVRD